MSGAGMQIITVEQLEELGACRDGIDWFKAAGETDVAKVCYALVADNRASWANRLLVRLFDKEKRVKFAVFSAREVLDIFEQKYPDDKRPRQAIEAAEAWLKNPSDTTAAAAAAAACAAYAAAAAADAAYAAYAADAACAAAAAAAADAADRRAMQLKIVEYGLGLLGYEKEGGK